MKIMQVAKLVKEAMVKAADVKYMDLLQNFLRSFDKSREAINLTKPIIMAEM